MNRSPSNSRPIERVLLLHNRYRISGGEDVVVEQESRLLSSAGVQVELVSVDNDSIESFADELVAAGSAIYSPRMRQRVASVISKFRPDVVHVHNFFPLLSPSVYDAAASHRCPVVQTLHNYRLLCANAQLFHNGRCCDVCLSQPLGLRAVVNACYRHHVFGTAVVAAMNGFHAMRGTWRYRVDRYIALTEFAKRLFVRSGVIPAQRISVKPNSVEDPGAGRGEGGYLLFVGRLSPEKGIGVLLEAAQKGEGLPLPLKIVGTGPLETSVREAQCAGRIELLGHCSRKEILRLMQDASALLLPSLWYEGLPMVAIEAFATGLPVIASRLGAMPEIIAEGKNGLLFEADNASALQRAVQRLHSSPVLAVSLRRGARATYLERYTPEANFRGLLSIYDGVRSVTAQRLQA